MSADPKSWEAILSRIEADLRWSNRKGNTAIEPWQPPTDLEPLPAEYEPRVRRIIRAQERAIARLSTERVELARQLSALRAIPGTVPPRPAVYLDRIG